MLLKSLTLRFYALSLGIMVAGSLAAADNDGYTAIFNGKNMEGWKFFFDPKAPKDIDTSKNCTVKEGAIICSGKPTGFFYTEKSFTNYVLEYEWRFPVGSKPESNSGCLVHMQEPFNKNFPRSLEPQGRYLNHGKIFPIGLGKDDLGWVKIGSAVLIFAGVYLVIHKKPEVIEESLTGTDPSQH